MSTAALPAIERVDPLRFPLHGSRLIEASAGTGKTYTIAALYLRLVLGQLQDTPDFRLGAAFVCAVAFVDGQREIVVDGTMTGRLVREPRGGNGFGYDPIFVPEGMDVTSAELSSEDKDAISHRGKALRALAERLG